MRPAACRLSLGRAPAGARYAPRAVLHRSSALQRSFASKKASHVTVKYDDRAVSFRVTAKYTFDDLLADAANYWNVDSKQHRLGDGQSIWCVDVVRRCS